MASDLSAFGSGLDLALRALTSPEARRREIQAAADALLVEAEREIRAAGYPVPKAVLRVNGSPVSSLSGIDPDHGVVSVSFALPAISDVVLAVLELIRSNSPVLTGRYRASHHVFADGQDVTDAMPPPEKQGTIKEWLVMPTVAYGRKVERWHGTYEAATALAQRRFGNQAAISFGYRSPLSGYVPGAANRAERAAIRNQPSRRAAMRTERATRLPYVSITPAGAI